MRQAAPWGNNCIPRYYEFTAFTIINTILCIQGSTWRTYSFLVSIMFAELVLNDLHFKSISVMSYDCELCRSWDPYTNMV